VVKTLSISFSIGGRSRLRDMCVSGLFVLFASAKAARAQTAEPGYETLDIRSRIRVQHLVSGTTRSPHTNLLYHQAAGKWRATLTSIKSASTKIGSSKRRIICMNK
jgi:hypothetical protein